MEVQSSGINIISIRIMQKKTDQIQCLVASKEILRVKWLLLVLRDPGVEEAQIWIGEVEEDFTSNMMVGKIIPGIQCLAWVGVKETEIGREEADGEFCLVSVKLLFTILSVVCTVNFCYIRITIWLYLICENICRDECLVELPPPCHA